MPTADITLLAVENDRLQARILKHELQGLGYGLAGTARTADEAETLFDALRPDLVLLDVHLDGSRVTEVAGQSAVQIDDGFDRAWRRVGLSLDRTGFTVEDRDRSKGVYFVRYVEPSVGKSEPGFLGKLFSFSKPETTPVKFRVSVVSQDTLTLVSVQNASGQPDRSDSAQRILKVIAEDLK